MVDRPPDLDRAPHAGRARDRPRHRQHRLHLDPGREAAGRSSRPGAHASASALAMVMRILLLLSLSWIMGLTAPLFTVPLGHAVSRARPDPARRRPVPDRQEHPRDPRQARGRRGRRSRRGVAASFASVLAQIMLLDIVFSLDSVITAVGMAQHVGDHDRRRGRRRAGDDGLRAADQRLRRAPPDDEDAGALVPAR